LNRVRLEPGWHTNIIAVFNVNRNERLLAEPYGEGVSAGAAIGRRGLIRLRLCLGREAGLVSMVCGDHCDGEVRRVLDELHPYPASVRSAVPGLKDGEKMYRAGGPHTAFFGDRQRARTPARLVVALPGIAAPRTGKRTSGRATPPGKWSVSSGPNSAP